MEEQVTSLFRDILLVCDEQGLIGKDMFAVDGCKLPSNASKQWSGTKEDLKKKAAKLQTAIGRIVNKHKELDEIQQDSDIVEHEQAKLKTLQKNYQKIKDWLSENDDRQGPTPAAGEHLRHTHVEAVDVRPLLSVHLDRDEGPVHEPGHLIVLEGFPLHDMAPVAGRVADGQENGPVLQPGGLEGLLGPGVPGDGVVGVGQQIGALLVDEAVGGDHVHIALSSAPGHEWRCQDE